MINIVINCSWLRLEGLQTGQRQRAIEEFSQRLETAQTMQARKLLTQIS
jgi:hypothetical protein